MQFPGDVIAMDLPCKYESAYIINQETIEMRYLNVDLIKDESEITFTTRCPDSGSEEITVGLFTFQFLHVFNCVVIFGVKLK
jgi:hypothetical protein